MIKSRIVIVALISLLLFCVSSFPSITAANRVKIPSSTVSSPRNLLVWMCLEICSQYSNEIYSQIQSIKDNPIINQVSYERFSVGSAGDFLDFSKEFNLTNVNTLLPSTVDQYPMISSWPHRVDFIVYMRTLWANPQPFIDSAIETAKIYGFKGYNLDLEPTDNVTMADGVLYAEFIGFLAAELNGAGLQLSVDIASWGPIWNFTLIAETKANTIMSMDTYATNQTTWNKRFNLLLSKVNLNQVGVGLDNEQEWSSDLLMQRFSAINEAKIQNIGIWKMPLQDYFWPYLNQWKAGARNIVEVRS